MVKDNSDSEKGNLLPPHRLLLSINSKGSFICTIPDRIAHTTTFVTPVVEHWLEREIAQWVHPMKDRSDESANETGAYTTGPHFVAILHSGFDPSITTLPQYIVLNRFRTPPAMQPIVEHELFMIDESQMLHRSSTHVPIFTRGSFHKAILALHSS